MKHKKKIIFLTWFLIIINLFTIIPFYNNYMWIKYAWKQEYEKAHFYFQKTPNHHSRYNDAIIYYKEWEYEKALETSYYSVNSDNMDLKFKSEHNLGNIYYKIWEKEDNKDKKLENYLNSLMYYDYALNIKYDIETKKNRDFVEEKIKKLEEEKNNEEQSQESNNSNQGEDKAEDNKQNWNTKENETENNNNQENTNSNNESSSLSEEDIKNLEEYAQFLKDIQSSNSEAFNKVYEEQSNDPFGVFFEDEFFNNFFYNPFIDMFDNRESNSKDW